MAGKASGIETAAGTVGKTRKAHYAVLGAICVLVLGVYAWSAKSGCWELVGQQASRSYYNLLIQGFRAGKLNLQREVPSGLAQLADPYDPKANAPYLMYAGLPLYDISYYKGTLHLYFGVTPALVLFWPWHVLTGGYLFHKEAVVIFCAVGFLASTGLLWAAWRRYFSAVGIGVVATCALALGLASGTLLILKPCDVYEVAVGSGYALIMVCLLAIWHALHATRGRGWWLAGASLACGLALGSRPSLLFGAVILLAPVGFAWRQRAEGGQRPPLWTLWLGAIGPITIIGLGLLLLNCLRFDNPFEFGQRYQLAGNRQAAAQQFSPSYLWVNFRVAFLEPARWSGRFPFVHDIAIPHLPRGYNVEHPFGILSCIPLVWLALAAPLVWRSRLAKRSPLRWFGTALALLSGICALTVCLHNSMTVRYEVEFLPALVWLAVFGILGLGRAVTQRQVWGWSWGLLLVLSVAFNWLGACDRYVGTYAVVGKMFANKGQINEAIALFQKALTLRPDNAEVQSGLGAALLHQGKLAEGVEHLEEAVRLKPEDGAAQNNLGTGLLQQGKLGEAIGHLEQALRLQPQNATLHNNLGTALLQRGKLGEAIGHLELALQLDPNYAEAHSSLGFALSQQGNVVEAISHLEQVLRLKPEDSGTRYCLAWLLATCRDGSVRNGARAVELAEGADRATGGKDPAILDTLAAAYAEAGRFIDAVRTAQAAIQLQKANGRAQQALSIEERLKLYQAGRPYHQE